MPMLGVPGMVARKVHPPGSSLQTFLEIDARLWVQVLCVSECMNSSISIVTRQRNRLQHSNRSKECDWHALY